MKKISKLVFVFTVLNSACAFFAHADFDLKQATLKIESPKSLGEWVPSVDGTTYYQLVDGSRIDRFDYKTGKRVATVFDASTARGCDVKLFDGFSFTEDETDILLYTNKEYIYRRSFKADYYIHEIKHNIFKPLTDKGAVQAAQFSHDGRMVAFVYDNNIYLKKLDYGSEVQVTTDGVKRSVVNGVPDWAYEEEFAMNTSITFSPSDSIVAYIKWNEAEVGEYSLPIYEGVCPAYTEYSQYPGTFTYKYPVAGTANSVVSVHGYDVQTRKTKQMKLPADTYYVPNIQFGKSDERLMVTTLNRDQNDVKIYAVNPKSTVAKQVYHETSKSWIDINNFTATTTYYKDFFVVLSSKSGYAHLYKYSNSGSQLAQITSGDWEVTSYYGYDSVLRNFYFQSTKGGATTRTVSKIDAKGIITNLSSTTGWNGASFNNNFDYCVLSHSSLTTPPQYTLLSKGKKLRDLELNKTYATEFTGTDIPKKEFFTCSVEGNTLNGYMIKPLNFDASKKYPVIMSQYSGPGSQSVTDKWSLDWEQYAAIEGFIVVCVDGRGTGGRGKAWESSVYMNLGHYESVDQIGAAKYLATLPYVDAKNIGIYGWSYGGYETIMAMSQTDSPFAAGVAIAPVTDWRFYDTIYAERYMRTPQQNESGYNSSSAIKAIPNLKGRLLIMAGTLDDNVHISNTLQYTAELTAQNKICDMMIFANKNHSIRGCETRYAVYLKVLDFFKLRLQNK